MAQIDASEIISLLHENVPSMPEEEKCAILMTVMGALGNHKQYTKPSENSKTKNITGISLYCKVGGRVNVKGNLIVRRTGAVGVEALSPIFNCEALKNLPVKEVEVSIADSSSADDVEADLKALGV